MITKLKEYGLTTSEIEELENFQSRDGFVLLDENELDETDDYLNEFSIYDNLIAFMKDDNSNYWCWYKDGPMKGMICYLDHEETNLEPKFRDLISFLKVINDNPSAYDFFDLDEAKFDFPNSTATIEFLQRKQIISTLKSDFIKEENEEVRAQLAFCIIALTSIQEIEDNIYPLLDDEDMYIQERAIQILGFHHYKAAKEKLTQLQSTSMHNGRTAAKIALQKING